MLACPESDASAAPTRRDTWPANGMPRVRAARAMAKYDSRVSWPCTLMKSTPSLMSESTAGAASAGVFTRRCGMGTSPPSRYGPEATTRGPMTDPCAMSRAPGSERWPVAGHVAHASDAVGDVEREHVPSAGHGEVHVHVPQAGDQELAATVDDARTGGDSGGGGRTFGDDAIAANDDVPIGARLSAASVDDGDVGERYFLCFEARGAQKGSRGTTGFAKKHLTTGDTEDTGCQGEWHVRRQLPWALLFPLRPLCPLWFKLFADCNKRRCRFEALRRRSPGTSSSPRRGGSSRPWSCRDAARRAGRGGPVRHEPLPRRLRSCLTPSQSAEDRACRA